MRLGLKMPVRMRRFAILGAAALSAGTLAQPDDLSDAHLADRPGPGGTADLVSTGFHWC
jgi:hypothetical protein